MLFMTWISQKLNLLSEKHKVEQAENENELTKNTDLVILAVKPNIYDIVLEKIKENIDEKKIVLTIATGYSVDRAEKILKK